MTGSGSAFFVIFEKKKSLLNAQKMIKKQRNSFWTKIVQTV
jgi:4-diphosphocytidyl-2C-methyl-D-erythritol kinase